MHWIKILGQVLCYAYSCHMCSSHRTSHMQLRHGRRAIESSSLATLLAFCIVYALTIGPYSSSEDFSCHRPYMHPTELMLMPIL